jgi:stage II sporulation protein D
MALDPSRSYAARETGSSVSLLSSSGRTLARCGHRLHADSGGVIEIAGVGLYRGALEAVPTGAGLDVVNALDVNDYVRGSEPAEVPAEWPMATLKAFAVAVRSIALSTDVGGGTFDVYPDTRTQNYGGVAAEQARTDTAARATLSQVVTYEGRVAQTTYFSSSGGQTESGFLGAPPVPYLESVPDPYDYYSPLHRWTLHFSQAEMEARLGPYVPGRFLGIRVTERGESPRIDYAQLIGSGGRATIRGDTLATALGLYDRWAYFRRVG